VMQQSVISVDPCESVAALEFYFRFLCGSVSLW
jgi:hypothetical protein